MSLFNDYNVCKMAYEKKELKEYLCGEGNYAEPADRYSDAPSLDVPTRMSCINEYYNETQDIGAINYFKDSLIEISGVDTDKLQIAVKYVMAQLNLEKRESSSFKLDDKEFFDKLRVQILKLSPENKEEKSEKDNELLEMLEIQNDFISGYTGYSIK